MPRRLKTVTVFVAGAFGFVASLLALIETSKETWRKIGDFVYPGVVIGTLAVSLLIAIAVIVVMHRQHTTATDPEAQQQVDRILSTLPRVFMDNIAYADFVAPWRDDTAGYPLSKFIHEFNGPEAEFSNDKLEQRRQQLKKTANDFAMAEAMGIDHRQDGFRYVGVGDDEASVDDEARERLERNAKKIRQAATEFRDAHDAFVREARKQQFDTSHLSDDPPTAPWESE
jgi:hypothetical protein